MQQIDLPQTEWLHSHIVNCQNIIFFNISIVFLLNAAVNVYFHPLRNKFKEEEMSVTKPQEKAYHFKLKHWG